MQLDKPMKYIVIEERTPAHEAVKGRQPNRCVVIFDARLSPTLVCAGITQREHEILSDGSIVEEGEYEEPKFGPSRMARRLRDALGCGDLSVNDMLNLVEQHRQDSESLARVNEVLKANELRVSHTITRPLVKTHTAIWQEGYKAGTEGEGVSHNPYVDGYNEPFTEAGQWEAGRQAARAANAHVR